MFFCVLIVLCYVCDVYVCTRMCVGEREQKEKGREKKKRTTNFIGPFGRQHNPPPPLGKKDEGRVELKPDTPLEV